MMPDSGPRFRSVPAAASLLGILMLCSGPPAFPQNPTEEERAVYRETTGDREVRIVSVERRQGDGFVLRSESDSGERHEIETDRQLRTLSWRYADPGSGTDIEAVRSGDTIRISGMLHGEKVVREHRPGDVPWYQSIERSLEAFATGDGPEPLAFAVIDPDRLQLHRMEARREGRETVWPGGTKTPAVRVRIRPAGFAGLFWSSSYWFRLPDGKMVYHEGARGGPGTPLTRMALISETDS